MAGALFPALLKPEVLERMRLNGWEFVDYLDGDECVCSGMVKGPEIHITIAPEWRGRALSRRRVRDFLAPLMARHGYLATRIRREGAEAQAFVTRLGFKRTWEDPMFFYYELTQLPFERKAK